MAEIGEVMILPGLEEQREGQHEVVQQTFDMS